jgi:formylglycine-generating enzyme required for sulfatase activity
MPLPELSPLPRSKPTPPRALCLAGMVPHDYPSYYSARRACEQGGKRLCTEAEWERACKGERQTAFPYGNDYRAQPCNVGQQLHPAAVLHGLSSSGHLDPRLNLLSVAGDEPLLRVTGASRACASVWGKDAAYDMVGNLDEWVDDPDGVFRGGFYARRTTSGCASQVRNHSATYFDYSTGTRCCKDAQSRQ